jgi:hypothetical protein
MKQEIYDEIAKMAREKLNTVKVIRRGLTQTAINLVQTMRGAEYAFMGSIDILEHRGNKIEIGFLSRTEELKAHAHMTGEGRLPMRQFFGVSDYEVETVSSKNKDLFERLSKDKKTAQSAENTEKMTLLEQLRSEANRRK